MLVTLHIISWHRPCLLIIKNLYFWKSSEEIASLTMLSDLKNWIGMIYFYLLLNHGIFVLACFASYRIPFLEYT